MKKINATEIDVLNIFVSEMENKGQTRNVTRLDIDAEFAAEINENEGLKITLEELHKLTDKCLANEWLEGKIMGGGPHACLQLTATGHGVVRSTKMKIQQMEERTIHKKISDYIVDHKGLFSLIAVVIGGITLFMKITGDGK